MSTSSTPAAPLHLALALGGEPERSTPFWAHLAGEAEAGLLDLVTLDGGAASGEGLDALLVATRVAAATTSIGLLPAVHAGRSEPSRIARAVEALDAATSGRAGVQLRVPVPADEQGWVQAVRRAWGAGSTGTGPVVALPARPGRGHRSLPAPAADLGFVSPRTTVDAQQLVAAARTSGAPRHLLGDLVVVLDDDAARARERAEHATSSTAPQGTRVFAGTPAQLADLALAWRTAGLAGLRLHPAELVRDLHGVTRGLVPELQRRGAFRRSYRETGLRERLADGGPAGSAGSAARAAA